MNRAFNLKKLWFGHVLIIIFVALPGQAQEVIATYKGIVRTTDGEFEVPCHLISTAKLKYPPKARRYKYLGQVIVKFGIDTTGQVTDPAVIASEPAGIFERAAMKHIKSYTWQPPLLDGNPVNVDEVAIKLIFDPEKRS